MSKSVISVFLALLLINMVLAASPDFKTFPMLTLLVKEYNEKEMNLYDALQNNNIKIINDYLADDFEERVSTHPNQPIPRKEWIDRMLKFPHLQKRMIQQMAVRNLDFINIVSYLWAWPKNAKKGTPSYYVIDIWKEKENKTQLMARYIASVNL